MTIEEDDLEIEPFRGNVITRHFILYGRGRLSYSVFVHQLFPLQSQPDPLAFFLIGLRMQLHGAGRAR